MGVQVKKVQRIGAVVTVLSMAAIGVASLQNRTATLTYADGRVLAVNTQTLSTLPPGNLGKQAIRSLAADAIIGYYDKGYNYHAQHMKSPQVLSPVDAKDIEGRDISGVDLAAK